MPKVHKAVSRRSGSGYNDQGNDIYVNNKLKLLFNQFAIINNNCTVYLDWSFE